LSCLTAQAICLVWLPKNLVRFNYEDFGLEQAVGAIKARVQENGGEYSPLTTLKRAEIYKADELYRQDKLRMSSEKGLEAIFQKVAELFGHIESHCADINARGSIQIRCGKKLEKGNATQSCGLTNDRVGMIVNWQQPYSNTLNNSGLVISEYNGALILPSEVGRMYVFTPERIAEENCGNEVFAGIVPRP
jgi:hypothetical protein